MPGYAPEEYGSENNELDFQDFLFKKVDFQDQKSVVIWSVILYD